MKTFHFTALILIASILSSRADDRGLGVITYNGKSYSECRLDGISTDGIDISSKNVLCHRVYSYLILYDPTALPVMILRVVHGRRDISHIKVQ